MNQSGMADDGYLQMGLDGLSRAAAGDYFVHGHLAASVLAACFFCREQPVEQQVPAAMARIIARELDGEALFTRAPRGHADHSLLPHLVEAMSRDAASYREVGHNIIFSALALKALRSLPDALTGFHAHGISRLVDRFQPGPDARAQAVAIPGPDDEAALTGFIGAEFLQALERYSGYGQGWAGHILTFGHAILELQRMGFQDFADRAHRAYSTFIGVARSGPGPDSRAIPEHERTAWTPLQTEYWRNRHSLRRNLGHRFKYPYSFYGLLQRFGDPGLKRRCLEQSYRIF